MFPSLQEHVKPLAFGWQMLFKIVFDLSEIGDASVDSVDSIESDKSLKNEFG